MAEYIEREAVMKIIDDYGCTHGGTLGSHSGAVDVVGSAIYKLPAADVVPVKHGHWKKGKGYERPTENGFVHDDKYICDCCGWGCCCETKLDFNFCPSCGAKIMDGGDNE